MEMFSDYEPSPKDQQPQSQHKKEQVKLTLTITGCKECPSCHFDEDDMGPFDSYHCSKLPHSKNYISKLDVNKIKDNCPLRN